jgi:hypothetical protein
LNLGPVLIYAGQEVGEPAAGAEGFSGDDGRTSIFDYSTIPELQKWFNQGRCDGGKLSENQKLLRKWYSDLIHLAQNNPTVSNGYLYDLMWVNEDIPDRDKVYAFLRYGGTDEEEILLIIAGFGGPEITTHIKIPEHALNTIGFGAMQRISVQSIYPEMKPSEIHLYSQIISVGIPVIFNQTGYCAYVLS